MVERVLGKDEVTSSILVSGSISGLPPCAGVKEKTFPYLSWQATRSSERFEYYSQEIKTMAREIITLACTECGRRNYTTKKDRKKTTGRLERSKYCPFDRKHTLHRETRS